MKRSKNISEQSASAVIGNYQLLAEKLSGIPADMAPRIDRELSLIVTGMEMQLGVSAGGIASTAPRPTV